MDYTIADEVAALIPSKAVQEYVLKTGWKFTDAEKVALLGFYSDLTLAENHLWKRRIAEKTSDKELKKKLIEWVELEENFIRQAPENSEHQYYYSLEAHRDGQWDPECYSTWDAALAEGKARCTEYETGFTIRKMLPEDKMPSDEAWEQDDELYLSYDYDIHGELKSISYNYSPDYYWEFMETWFEFPNPFEKGDIIKTHWGLYGIVETTQQNWKLMMDRHRKDSYGDIGDNLIHIQGLIEENGCFINYFDSIYPFHLEYYIPNENRREDYGSMDKLLMCASLYMRGQGSLEDLHTATVEYRGNVMSARKRRLRLLMRILGDNRWMSRDEILKAVPDDEHEEFANVFFSLMDELVENGLVQSITSPDKGWARYRYGGRELDGFVYDVYYCGLEDKYFSFNHAYWEGTKQ